MILPWCLAVECQDKTELKELRLQNESLLNIFCGKFIIQSSRETWGKRVHSGSAVHMSGQLAGNVLIFSLQNYFAIFINNDNSEVGGCTGHPCGELSWGEGRCGDYKTHPASADRPVGNPTSSQYQHRVSSDQEKFGAGLV